MMFAVVLSMLAVHFIFPIMHLIPTYWRLIGLLPLFAGFALSYTAEKQFRQIGTTVHPSGMTTRLVTDGLYKFSRNPMYFGMVSILLGVTCLLGSLTPFGIVLCFIWWISTRFIIKEEQMLATQFGDDWLEYKARVRRWI